MSDDVLAILYNDLIQMDRETAIVLESWPSALEFVNSMGANYPEGILKKWHIRLQFLEGDKVLELAFLDNDDLDGLEKAVHDTIEAMFSKVRASNN